MQECRDCKKSLHFLSENGGIHSFSAYESTVREKLRKNQMKCWEIKLSDWDFSLGRVEILGGAVEKPVESVNNFMNISQFSTIMVTDGGIIHNFLT